MKKLSFLCSLVFILFTFFLSSCDKEICATCTEDVTGVSEPFCGSKSEVDAFEDTLVELGSPLGQVWNCVR